MKLPLYLKKYFWEIDTSKLNLKEKTEYVITRLLEYGDPPAIRWLLKTYGIRQIKKAFLESRGLSARTINFWCLYFNLNKNNVLCLTKSYQDQRKAHWPY